MRGRHIHIENEEDRKKRITDILFVGGALVFVAIAIFFTIQYFNVKSKRNQALEEYKVAVTMLEQKKEEKAAKDQEYQKLVDEIDRLKKELEEYEAKS